MLVDRTSGHDGVGIESKVAMLNVQIPGAVRVRQTRRPGRESRRVYGIWSCL